MNESRTLRVRLFQFTIQNSRFTIIFFVAAFAHHWRVGGGSPEGRPANDDTPRRGVEYFNSQFIIHNSQFKIQDSRLFILIVVCKFGGWGCRRRRAPELGDFRENRTNLLIFSRTDFEFRNLMFIFAKTTFINLKPHNYEKISIFTPCCDFLFAKYKLCARSRLA